MPADVEISVIIPLVETRGRALDSISSWARQTLAAERYEVLAVGDGRDAAFRGRVEERLGSNGRFIEAAGRHATALYNVGARHARAPWLFVTESHCVGDPRCLERMLAFVGDHGLDGAFCTSGGLPGNLFSRMEQRLFEAEVRKRRDANANVVSVRGTAIRKTQFVEAGGFAERYGHFSALLLGDALQARGARMGFAEDALVFHENMDNAPDLIESLREYGRDECRFAADAQRSSRRCHVWDERAAWTKPIARARLITLLRSLPLFVARPRDAAIWASTFADLLAAAVVGPDGGLWMARARLWWLRLRLALARGQPDAYFRHYEDLWSSAIRHGAYELVSERAPAGAVSDTPYDIAETDERLVGFHEMERDDRGSFRWSEPVALVQIAAGSGPRDVSLRLHHACDGAIDSLGIFFDGSRVRGFERQGDPPCVRFSIPGALPASRPAHQLVWVCRPHPLDGGSDTRALGLPIAGIEITSTSRR